MFLVYLHSYDVFMFFSILDVSLPESPYAPSPALTVNSIASSGSSGRNTRKRKLGEVEKVMIDS
jgi:hypothetical protein